MKKKRTGLPYSNCKEGTKEKHRTKIRAGLSDYNEAVWQDFGISMKEVIYHPELPKNIKITVENNKEYLKNAIESAKIKEKMSLTDRSYQIGLNNGFINGSSLRQVKQAESLLNNLLEINKNDYGFYFKPTEKIEFVLTNIIKELNKNPRTRLIPNQSIPLKLSADGVNITFSNIKALNVTFTCLLEKQKAKTSSGNYLLGIFIFFNLKSISR